MKLSTLAAAAAALALASAPAWANDVTQSVSLVGMNATFDAVHTDSLSFNDTFTFDVSGSVLATVSAITISLTPQQNIGFTGATLNGNALTLSSSGGGFIESFFTPAPLSLTGPLVLMVSGNSGAGGGVNASYAGTLNVTAVPEPGSLALILAGLAAVGGIARRRRA